MKFEAVGLRLISFFNSKYYWNRKYLQSGIQISVALYFCVKYSKRLQSCLFTSQKAHMHYKIEHLRILKLLFSLIKQKRIRKQSWLMNTFPLPSTSKKKPFQKCQLCHLDFKMYSFLKGTLTIIINNITE